MGTLQNCKQQQGTWHPKATPSDYCRKGTDVKSWASSQPLGAEAGPSPALQHSLPQCWQWALLLSASPQTSFLKWVCWWSEEIRKWNKNKDGETTTEKERVQKSRAEVETGSCFMTYEGGLQQNELVPSLTLKRGNWMQNTLLLLSCLGGLALSWICYCDGSPACVPTCKIRVPVNQEGSICLLDRKPWWLIY